MALPSVDVEAVVASADWNELVANLNGTVPTDGRTSSPLKWTRHSSTSVYSAHINQVDTTNGLIEKWTYGPVGSETTVATMTKNGLNVTNVKFVGPRPWADLTAMPSYVSASDPDDAIDEWLTAASGGYAYAPANTYVVNATHSIPPNTIIVGAGMGVTTFKRATTFSSATAHLFTMVADCEIHDVSFDGSTGTLGTLSAFIDCEVFCNGARNRLERVEFFAPSAQFCIQINDRDFQANDSVFTGNNVGGDVESTFGNLAAWYQDGTGCENHAFYHCRFTDFNQGAGMLGLQGTVQGCYFLDNHKSNTPSTGTHIGVGGVAGAGGRIIGNYFGPIGTRATGGMEARQGIGGLIVSENIFEGGSDFGSGNAGAGIFIADYDPTGTVVRHVTVTNNIVLNWPGAGIAIGEAASADLDDCVVSGNVVYNNGYSGIQSNVSSIVIANNVCANNGQYASATDRAGIYVKAAAAWFVVTGNRCFDTGGGGGTQQYGIQVASGASDQYVISSNILVGNVNSVGLLDGGSGTNKQLFGNMPQTAPARLIHAGDIVVTSGAITTASASAGLGYATGAGSSATQGTSKSTTVAFNAMCGTITMHNATLNADTTVSFTFTNTSIAANDLLILNHTSGGTAGAYTLNAQVGAGSATINVRNITAGNLGEAIVIRFAVIKGVVT